MTVLQRMISEAKAEHDAQWAVAIASPMGNHTKEYATQQEALAHNPGFSFVAIWQNERGMWQCA